MFEASTPVTIGLVVMVFAGVGASVTFLVWLWRQFKSLRDEITGLIEKSEAAAEKRIGEASSQLSLAQGQVALLREKLHAIELRMMQMRAEIAETYMTKASAGHAIERLTTELVGLRSDIDGRFNSIEKHLRSGKASG